MFNKKRFAMLVVSGMVCAGVSGSLLLCSNRFSNSVAAENTDTYNKTWNFKGSTSGGDDGDWTITGNTKQSGYQLVPAAAGTPAVFTLNTDIFTVSTQPTNAITVKIRVATYGNGHNPSSSNTSISFKGAEESSTWSSSTWTDTYPSSKTYVTLATTLARAATPSTITKLVGSFDTNSGVKQLRIQSITVSCTPAVPSFGTLGTIDVSTSGSFKDTFLAGDQFSTTGISAVATSTTSVTKNLEVTDLSLFIGSTNITAGHNFTSAEIGSVTITAKYTLDSVTAEDTFVVTVQDLDHIVLDTSKATLGFNKGETFSGASVTGTAYGDATEANAATKSIANASLSFYKDSSKTTSLTDYVFLQSDAGTFTVYAFYKLNATETEKYASYSLTIAIDASYSLTLSSTNTFLASNSTADIGANGYCKSLDVSGQRFTLSVHGTDSLKTKVMTAESSGQQIGTTDNAATSIVLKSGIFSTSLSERKITKAIITVCGASAASSGTITSSFTGIETQSYSGNSDKKMTFTSSEGVYGSVSFTFSDIVRGVKIKNVKIFADVDTTDTGKAYGFAHDVEMADSCDTTKYSALANAYTALSDTAKATANAIVIDDLADKTTTSDSVIGRCTVSQKMAAMKLRAEAGSNASLTFGEKNDSENVMVIAIGSALLLASGLAIVMIKRKHA